MSGEFGDEQSPGCFLHDWMRAAVDACRDEGEHRITKMCEPIFESMYEIARLISWVEAGDSAEYRNMLRMREHLHALRSHTAMALFYIDRIERLGETEGQECLDRLSDAYAEQGRRMRGEM